MMKIYQKNKFRNKKTIGCLEKNRVCFLKKNMIL